jgi:hypothetical protein
MTAEVKTEPAKARPWQWPGEWFRDEKFWREVTARGLSGHIVVFLAYSAAILLASSKLQSVSFVGGQLLGIIVLSSGFIAAFFTFLGKSARGKIDKFADAGSRAVSTMTRQPPGALLNLGEYFWSWATRLR